MITFAGSLDALEQWLEGRGRDGLVIVPTASAFSNPSQSTASALERFGGTVVSIMNRADAMQSENADIIRSATLAICLDGSPLHARAVWRTSPVGEALRVTNVATVGGVGSVFGSVMIDPRGGAPTVGLGRFDDVAITTTSATDDLPRTKQLVGPDITLVVLGESGLVTFDGQWLANGAYYASRGSSEVVFSSR